MAATRLAPGAVMAPLTLQEIVAVVGPQFEAVRQDIGELRVEVREEVGKLREEVAREVERGVRSAVRLNGSEERLEKLEKRGDGVTTTTTTATTVGKGGDVVAMLNLVLGWVFRFMLAGAALAAGLNLAKVVELWPK